MKLDLTLGDFFTGLLAALAEKGVRVLSIRGDDFPRAVEVAYRALEGLAGTYEVDPRFVVFLDPIHADSAVVKEGVAAAVLRDVASIDGFEYQDLWIKVDPELAETLLEQLPGGSGLYARVADVFLASYPYVAA